MQFPFSRFYAKTHSCCEQRLQHSKPPSQSQTANPLGKHHADSRSIMGFACFLRVFHVLLLFLSANFAGFSYFNLDFHRADAAD
jgi:hypothetical protein